jgi:DNA topoisomerase-1
VENMREMISHFSHENIYLGTDDDREGEAIAWHICMTFELSMEKVHRILFHEITEPALKEAVKTPLKLRMNIVLAQQARQVLDRLVGFQISPLLTKRINNGDTPPLSAGRCQTPALRLIYDREEKKKNVGEKIQKYQVNGYFFSQMLMFTLQKKINTIEECICFLEKTREWKHELKLNDPQEKKMKAPIPFNTSLLLQTANTQLQLSPKQTMLYCQQLYQNGYITYMRTESTNYSETFLSKVHAFILEKTGSLEYISSESVKKENTHAHEAIRVTNLHCSYKEIAFDIEKETRKDKEQRQKLYQLIWKRSIESCMSEYIYKHIQVIITAPFDYYYTYELDIPIFLGWKKMVEEEKDLREEQMKKNALLLFLQSAKSPIKCMKVEAEVYISENNRHYTEAGLIKDLEEYGIGRPSTFAIILQTIQDRNYVVKKNIDGQKIKCTDLFLDLTTTKKDINYVEKERIIGTEKNKLVLQELGKLVIDELISTFSDLFSYNYTNKMELELDKISNESEEKEKEWYDICRECDEIIKKNTKEWKKELKQKYDINNDYELVFLKTGAVIHNKKTSEYKRIRSNLKIDFQKLRNKEYDLEELLEIPNEYLGEYEGQSVYLKNGPYGFYYICGEKTESIHLDKIEDITLDYIIGCLKTKKIYKNTRRVLNERISIRKGKYGDYIHYSDSDSESSSSSKTSPHFYNLKLFPNNYMICDTKEILQWLENTYGII